MAFKYQFLIRFIILAVLLAVATTLILTGCSVPHTISSFLGSMDRQAADVLPLPEPSPTQTVSSAPAAVPVS
ncbi:MAG: hypothetical protein HDQ87_11525 [Clostridia bacterium]|nr:hypothetical protein [Clostridia bacterium]